LFSLVVFEGNSVETVILSKMIMVGSFFCCDNTVLKTADSLRREIYLLPCDLLEVDLAVSTITEIEQEFTARLVNRREKFAVHLPYNVAI
jgi:hypothetical protein